MPSGKFLFLFLCCLPAALNCLVQKERIALLSGSTQQYKNWKKNSEDKMLKNPAEIPKHKLVQLINWYYTIVLKDADNFSHH